MQDQKFKVGDSVRVVHYQVGIKDMQDMLGNVYTIGTVGNNSYSLEEEPVWLWKEEWLELEKPARKIDENEFIDLFKGD